MELIRGKIYKYIYTNHCLIARCLETDTKKIQGYLEWYMDNSKNDWRSWSNICSGSKTIELPTEDQEKWFLACEQANKFIPKEEALKSFKQEVLVQTNLSQKDACGTCKYNSDCSRGPHNINGETKCSAYGGQHYPKEINTMKQELTSLPEKWYFKVTKDNYQQFKHIRSLCGTYGHITSDSYDRLGWGIWRDSTPPNTYTEITFPQFKAWVLKENVEEVPEYVELYKSGWDDKLLNTIWKTSNRFPSENVNWTTSWTWKYLLTDENHKQYFRASTASAYNAQFKKEEPMDLLAEAKRRYPVGSKFKCVNGNKNSGYSSYNKTTDTWTVTDYKYTRVNEQPAIHSDNGWLYLEGKWATVVPEAKQPEEKKWKVGGWVRLTKDFDYRGNSYKKGEYHQITNVNSSNKPSVVCSNRTNGFGNANTLKVELYTEFSSQTPECEWVGMNKPGWYEEQQEKAQQQWSSWGLNNHLGYLGIKGDEKPVEKEQLYNVTIKKSKAQQVEVVPLQKPCIISTRKSKLNLIKL